MEYCSVRTKDDEWQRNFSKIVINAIKETHAATTIAEAKCRRAREAIQHGDKFEMWNVLQCYIREYRQFINSTSEITNICVYNVPPDIYERIDIKNIVSQLNTVIAFAYAKEAFNCAAKETVKTTLKKALIRSGLMSSEQIRLLEKGML